MGVTGGCPVLLQQAKAQFAAFRPDFGIMPRQFCEGAAMRRVKDPFFAVMTFVREGAGGQGQQGQAEQFAFEHGFLLWV